MSEVDPQALKAAIREQARKNRVAQKQKEEISRDICEEFMAMPEYARAKTVMWYVDAGSEVRTRHMLPEAMAKSAKVIIPYCIVETNELELFWLEDMSELVEGAYKILEPASDLRAMPSKLIKPEEIDLVAVPGTAFDPIGGRMGQGKGYYDRLLAKIRPEVPLIALSFECQVFPHIPMAAHDVYMDLVLTEQKNYVGKGRKK